MLDSGLVNRGSRPAPTQSPDGSRIILNDLPPPKQKWVLTAESFDDMLSWLDPDRHQAGQKYEDIRTRLVSRFRQLGCRDAEDLANKTFDRVAKKLPQIIDTFVGKREPYFFSVAHFVYKEYLRKPVMMSLTTSDFQQPDLPDPEELLDKEMLDSCLKDCLEKLSPNKRELVTDYYRGKRKVKIQSRQELAERLGIKLSNLRLKAQRIRVTLKECIFDCMSRKQWSTKH